MIMIYYLFEEKNDNIITINSLFLKHLLQLSPIIIQYYNYLYLYFQGFRRQIDLNKFIKHRYQIIIQDQLSC